MINDYKNSELEAMLIALKTQNAITVNEALDTIKKVHAEDPNLTPLWLINSLMDICKEGTENIDQICYVAGMLMMYADEYLSADQEVFVDFFMEYAIRLSQSTDNSFSTLIYGLGLFDLGKYIFFITKISTTEIFFRVYNSICAFRNMNFKRISKNDIAMCLYSLRVHRRANGEVYRQNKYEFDLAIRTLKEGLIGKSYKQAYS